MARLPAHQIAPYTPMRAYKCSNCGLVDRPTETFCRRCGHSQEFGPPEPKRRRERPVISIYRIGLVAAIAAGVYYFTSAHDGNTDAAYHDAVHQPPTPAFRSAVEPQPAGNFKTAVERSQSITAANQRQAEMDKMMAQPK